MDVGPTTHIPGSQGKIKVMRRRAELGLPLFHPDDAPIPIGITPQTSGHVVPYFNSDRIPRTPQEMANYYQKFLEALDQELHSEAA